MGIPKLTTWPWLFGGTVLTVLVIVNLINSSYGRAIVSIREDEIASELMGVNTTKYKVLAFVIGAMFAGLGGVMYAHYFYIIKPETFNFLKTFDILVMVVLGGLGSTTGYHSGGVYHRNNSSPSILPGNQDDFIRPYTNYRYDLSSPGTNGEQGIEHKDIR